MHGEDLPFAYGFRFLVLVNAGLFAFFILSFLTPVKKREWRSMGVTLAFFVALFTEIYGFPLTIYQYQDSGFSLAMIGMLIQWPAITTAVMFPVLIFEYYRLSKREESEMIELFGDEYRKYAEKRLMFIPWMGGRG